MQALRRLLLHILDYFHVWQCVRKHLSKSFRHNSCLKEACDDSGMEFSEWWNIIPVIPAVFCKCSIGMCKDYRAKDLLILAGEKGNPWQKDLLRPLEFRYTPTPWFVLGLIRVVMAGLALRYWSQSSSVWLLPHLPPVHPAASLPPHGPIFPVLSLPSTWRQPCLITTRYGAPCLFSDSWIDRMGSQTHLLSQRWRDLTVVVGWEGS